MRGPTEADDIPFSRDNPLLPELNAPEDIKEAVKASAKALGAGYGGNASKRIVESVLPSIPLRDNNILSDHLKLDVVVAFFANGPDDVILSLQLRDGEHENVKLDFSTPDRILDLEQSEVWLRVPYGLKVCIAREVRENEGPPARVRAIEYTRIARGAFLVGFVYYQGLGIQISPRAALSPTSEAVFDRMLGDIAIKVMRDYNRVYGIVADAVAAHTRK